MFADEERVAAQTRPEVAVGDAADGSGVASASCLDQHEEQASSLALCTRCAVQALVGGHRRIGPCAATVAHSQPCRLRRATEGR